ncbi:hypothetical protein ACRQ4C_01640 [Curtobacterium sp. SP.BCp]|uniref:hypothetical protein n=1 Tax=Curtobacterium sp. SP.BCp TaxID=3435230 RepID=UPI003F735091
MHQLDTAPAPVARHVSAPMPVVLSEVEQASRERVLREVALGAAVVAVAALGAALIFFAVLS